MAVRPRALGQRAAVALRQTGMISRLQWLILALVVGAAIALTWRWEIEAPIASAVDQQGEQPDVYMEGAVLSQFDDNGALRYRLTANRIAHYPERGLTRVQQPSLSLVRTGAPTWTASAQHGELTTPPAGPDSNANGQTSETVALQQSVELLQRNGTRFVRMRTEQLTVQPMARTARTDVAVMIDTEMAQTRAAGMRADLDTGHIRLTSGSGLRVTTVVQSIDRSFH